MLGHLALLALAASASASELAQRQTAKYCPGGTQICFSESKIAAHDITFRVAIPETTAAPFDILLSIVAPVSVGWAGLAWGGKMTNNPLTVGWANGKTAVVSSRLATGRSTPGVYAGAAYTVLPSTTTNATHWQLDALCKGCSQWSAGSLNPNGAVTFAWAKGSRAVATPSSNSSSFSYHDDRGTFSHDLASAKIPKGVFDAVAYDLANPASSSAALPAPTVVSSAVSLAPTVVSSVASLPPVVTATGAPVLTGITTSVVTLPAPSLPSSLTLVPPVSDEPYIPTATLPTGNLPTVTLPTGLLPTVDLPTGGNLPTGPIIISTRIITLPGPSPTHVSTSPVLPTRLTTLLPPKPEPSTTFVIITRVSTLPRPPSSRPSSGIRTLTSFPTQPKPTGWDVVTVTVTRQPTTQPAPQPTQQPGGGGPPWGGKGKGGGPPWGGKGKGKWGGGGRGRGRPEGGVDGETRRRR